MAAAKDLPPPRPVFARAVASLSAARPCEDRLPPPPFRSPAGDCEIDGAFAFLVKGVLSPPECRLLVSAAEQETFTERTQLPDRSKNSGTCAVWSPDLASHVFERLGHLLPATAGISADNDKIATLYQLRADGWPQCGALGRLVGVSPYVRVERYPCGAQLPPHRDTCVQVHGMSDSFTTLTIVVYLNDAFDGGETRLAISAEPSAWLDIRADMGDAIVFRQEILHMGGEVVCGSKYILRCDAIYSPVR